MDWNTVNRTSSPIRSRRRWPKAGAPAHSNSSSASLPSSCSTPRDEAIGGQGAHMTSHASRKMIAALQVSLDGFIQGPEGEKDWADSWASALGLTPDVDMFVLGAGMSPDYGEY